MQFRCLQAELLLYLFGNHRAERGDGSAGTKSLSKVPNRVPLLADLNEVSDFTMADPRAEFEGEYRCLFLLVWLSSTIYEVVTVFCSYAS